MGDAVPMMKKMPSKTIEESADELENLLSTMCKAIVDHPADVVLIRAVSPVGGFVAFEVTCRDRDAGALVGARGLLADSMRAIMVAAAAARKIRVTIQVMSKR